VRFTTESPPSNFINVGFCVGRTKKKLRTIIVCDKSLGEASHICELREFSLQHAFFHINFDIKMGYITWRIKHQVSKTSTLRLKCINTPPIMDSRALSLMVHHQPSLFHSLYVY
jgi:hypothetical protein